MIHHHRVVLRYVSSLGVLYVGQVLTRCLGIHAIRSCLAEKHSSCIEQRVFLCYTKKHMFVAFCRWCADVIPHLSTFQLETRKQFSFWKRTNRFCKFGLIVIFPLWLWYSPRVRSQICFVLSTNNAKHNRHNTKKTTPKHSPEYVCVSLWWLISNNNVPLSWSVVWSL